MVFATVCLVVLTVSLGTLSRRLALANASGKRWCVELAALAQCLSQLGVHDMATSAPLHNPNTETAHV